MVKTVAKTTTEINVGKLVELLRSLPPEMKARAIGIVEGMAMASKSRDAEKNKPA